MVGRPNAALLFTEQGSTLVALTRSARNGMVPERRLVQLALPWPRTLEHKPLAVSCFFSGHINDLGVQ